MTRPRDPNCDCEIEYPGARRIWCDHCLTDGPLPGSLADPSADEPPNPPYDMPTGVTTWRDL